MTFGILDEIAITDQELAQLSGPDLRQWIEIAEEAVRRRERLKIKSYYPETGPLRRELYRKHMEFFAAGAIHQERAFIAGNRVGKSEGGGGYEVTLHLTGEYPDWWPGRRFLGRPTDIWAAGEDAKTVRDTMQVILLGKPEARGTGLIPGDEILRMTARGGVPDAIDTVMVKHISGGISTLGFKSYDQRREAFQGTKRDVVWYDEEPPLDIYTEGLTRTMATVPGEDNGMTILTFTPLKGVSETVLTFLPGGKMA